MPSLYLLRHGKSDQRVMGPDRERPLRSRGRKAAGLVGRLLTARGEVPDLVLTSPAVRALATAELAAEAGGWKATLREEPAIYEGGVDDLLALVAGLHAAVERVLVVGHEPTTSATIERLTGARVVVPTAALAHVDVTSYAGVGDGSAELLWLVTPRMLADLDERPW
jgi:phosphohistidine phosphatase